MAKVGPEKAKTQAGKSAKRVAKKKRQQERNAYGDWKYKRSKIIRELNTMEGDRIRKNYSSKK